MRFILYFIAALTAVSPALAVCTTIDRITNTEICISQGGPSRCIPFTDLSTGSRVNWARQMTGIFQSLMEFRQPQVESVADEETRFDPPHREDYYLGDTDGIHHHNVTMDVVLVARCDIITVTWDGENFSVAIRNARRDITPEGEIIP